MTNPCFHCENRHPVCHGNCDKYKEWQKFHAAERAESRRQSELCTIHKNDFDQEFWHGKRRRRK